MRVPFHAINKILVVFVALFLLSSGSSLVATAQAKETTIPPVRLEDWKKSTQAEQRAFLLGLATMLELEKEWQGKHPLPLKQSLVNSWTQGLNGVTFTQLTEFIDEYSTQHPDELDKQVVEILWFKYVQPHVTAQKKAGR